MDVPSHADVVAQIDAFLARQDMAPSRLGREAFGEPQFVSQVRAGRVPRLERLALLNDFMRRRDEELERSVIVADDTAIPTPLHRLNAGAR